MSALKVYIAGPLFTPEQQEMITTIYEGLSFRLIEAFSPYHNSQDIFQGRKPSECTEEERKQVISDNITNLDWCDVVFAWVGGMGGFTDPGTIWEMGYATAKRKFVAAYVDDADTRQSMNLMLAATIDAFVRGREELKLALEYLRGERVASLEALRAYFNPAMDEQVARDQDPVV